jgi:hypothetical protein
MREQSANPADFSSPWQKRRGHHDPHEIDADQVTVRDWRITLRHG